ncbi:MAG: hybrid sensor histidine kinase/response regulator [Gemmatimonadales bacterium]|nr:hybrid sensor histidine kinase/response regulator [Gemmatimonadales bacterium]
MLREGAPRILVVDDDPTIARLVLHLLRSRGLGDGMHVMSGREALESLEGVDIVLLDHQLPDANGLEVLETIRARSNPPSVILITAHGNESFAAGALRLGADDYLAKDRSLLEMLPPVLERVRRNRELRKALDAAERDLVRAERLTAMGELTVALHHGINNPLMSASADVDLLLLHPDMPQPERQKALDDVRVSLHRIRDIVRQIGDLRAARTKTYLPGMQMVDLNGEAELAPPPHRGVALVHVAEEDLARIATLLLRHSGFTVERCVALDDLRRAAPRLGVVLVLVQGGTDAAGAHALGGFDPAAERDYRVVALVAGEPAPARAAGADRVVELPFDPVSFAAEMVEVTRQDPLHSPRSGSG